MPKFECDRCDGDVPDYLAGALMYGRLPVTCFSCLAEALASAGQTSPAQSAESRPNAATWSTEHAEGPTWECASCHRTDIIESELTGRGGHVIPNGIDLGVPDHCGPVQPYVPAEHAEGQPVQKMHTLEHAEDAQPSEAQ
jgi:hypothetical protein